MEAHLAHNQENAGSNPVSAIGTASQCSRRTRQGIAIPNCCLLIVQRENSAISGDADAPNLPSTAVNNQTHLRQRVEVMPADGILSNYYLRTLNKRMA